MIAPRVVALTGGIGGAKLVLGLDRSLPPGDLAAIVNTGDDFEHLGLHIAPDVDTTLYTLAGISNAVLGWGRADETWSFMETLAQLGGETWFRLGDRDLALHVERTRRLRDGEDLSAVTRAFAGAFGVATALIPMSNDPVRTMIGTSDARLAFQDYFVRLRCAPTVREISFAGADAARAAPAALAALASPRLEVIIVCPSNPYLSIDPILAVPGIREALAASTVPVIAVSPIIGAGAVKGPTAKIMLELGVQPSSATIAAHYAGLIDALVIDRADAAQAGGIGVPVLATPTLMHDLEDKRRLAAQVMKFAAGVGGRRQP